MHRCPCCSEVLLRHVRHGSVYWFCTHCWQEMPDLEIGIEVSKKRSPISRRIDLSAPLAV
ncbi:hypothetical protein OsccyDRAFT_2391 [Leptolyngbyaceae cyanobacterium JSC-12]|nr:hypothetical protein OsccyDRAFT_2391 [Leptolyngbyaceae cyanobacterium JSC-12]